MPLQKPVNAPPEDSKPVLNDPLAEFLSPGALFKTPEEDDSAPDELTAAFDEFEIGRASYNCMLKSASTEATNNAYIKSFNSKYPSIEWIAKNCGPGEYTLKFSWRRNVDEEDGKHFKTFQKIVNVSISDKCADEYADYQLALRLERMKKNRGKVQNAALEKVLESQFSDLGLSEKPKEEPKAGNPLENLEALSNSVAQISTVAEKLGMVRRDSSGPGWLEKLSPLLMTALPAVIKWVMDSSAKRGDEMKQLYTLLLTNASSSNNQLIELFKQQQGPGTGTQLMKEMADMVKGALDLKGLMTPEKESLSDRIFNMIEAFAPAIISVAAAPKAVRAVDPRAAAARAFVGASPDFQQAIHDPAQFRALVARLDAFFGWEQADTVLEVMGLSRPPESVKNPAQRYPAGDPRNEPAPATVTEETPGMQDQ